MTVDISRDFSEMSMLELFRIEMENHCEILSDNLLLLEKHPTDKDLLDSLMRAAHSAKGAARIIELEKIVQIAHAMEDIFVACQQSEVTLSREHIDILLKAVDMLDDISRLSEGEIESRLTTDSAAIESLLNELLTISTSNRQKPPTTNADALNLSMEAIDNPPHNSITERHAADMMDLFCTETEIHRQNLGRTLLAIERDGICTNNSNQMIGAAQAIKNVARIVEFEEAVRLTQTMEDTLLSCQYQKTPLTIENIQALRKGVDLLSAVTKASNAGAAAPLDGLSEEINIVTKSLQPIPPHEIESTPRETGRPAKSIANNSQPQAALPSSPSPTPSPKYARKIDDKESIHSIRVSAENMSRLLGLAGEVLVESRWLPSFSTEMYRIKHHQDEILQLLNTINKNFDFNQQKKLNKIRLSELRKRFNAYRNLIAEKIEILESHALHSADISHRLYREVIATRMLPFSEGIKGFPRLVRNLSRELGKEIKFEIIGAETPVDREILEKIEAPLNHLIRNAIDHGIESPENRLKIGKPREATLRLEARHRFGMLTITVSDDGQGIDLDKIRRIVVQKNLVSMTMASDLNDTELLEFLFLPNFTTKRSVNNISGRGVGLDVVRSAIHEIHGAVYTHAKRNKGTSFELQLPLTLSVMRSFLVEINNEVYAFPLVAIEHVVKISKNEIRELEGRQYFTFNERRIGLVPAQMVLEIDSPTTEEDHYLVVVLSDRRNHYGLIVDNSLGIRDLVVQTLDQKLGKIKDISSASILEDDTPVLIFDVEDMIRSMDILISSNRLGRIDSLICGEKKNAAKRILVVDDSITIREAERKMLTVRGYEVDVAVDGSDAWNRVRTGNYQLVITDVDMPRLDGIELVRLIKNDPELESLPLIVVSYKDRSEDRNRGLEAGADYYLTKGSFKDETLVNAVRDLIGEAEI